MCAHKTEVSSKIIVIANVYTRNMIERRKANGLCTDCGNPLDREGARCIKCCERKAKRERERKKWYADARICPVCGKESLFGDEKRCPECRAYDANYKASHVRYTEEMRIERRKSQKKMYETRKSNGICTRCGKRKADYGYYTCALCRCKDNDVRRIRSIKPDRKERYLAGLCYFCDNPVKEGYKVCEEHYQKNVASANSPKAKEARLRMKEKGILY